MEEHFGIHVVVDEPSRVGEARRLVMSVIKRLDFDDTAAGRVAIVTNELGNNILHHGGGGELLFRTVGSPGNSGIEILALDKGPGMQSVGQCLVDGFSTGNTPGTGLGAVVRLSDGGCDVYSRPNLGTAIVARLWPSNAVRPPRRRGFEIGAACVPYPGEEVSGDGWVWHRSEQQITLMVTDGIGHGPFAAEATREAIRVFRETVHRDVPTQFQRMHDALRRSRGAAIAVARLSLSDNQVHYVGVGNISGTIVDSDGTSRSMVSQSGIVGHQIRKIQEFTYPWAKNALLVMCSDGLGTRWQLNGYPGLHRRHPSLVAGVLYRDYRRARDDATVVVVKESDPLEEALHG